MIWPPQGSLCSFWTSSSQDNSLSVLSTSASLRKQILDVFGPSLVSGGGQERQRGTGVKGYSRASLEAQW